MLYSSFVNLSMTRKAKISVLLQVVIAIIMTYGIRDAKALRTEELHDKIKKAFKTKDDNSAIPGLDDIRRKGYPLETHDIKTTNGYILTVHRIPHGVSPETPEEAEKRRPILLQHGVMQTSVHWMMNSGNNSLAYLLVDNGFDVWLGNNRGNPYSYKHTSINLKNFSYWDFSFHEMGAEDIPNVIDYILGKTNKKKLSYVGYSMGTTQFFIAISMRPEYNAKVHVFISLAPVVFVDHGHNPLLLLGRNPATAKAFEFMRKTFRIGCFPDQNSGTFIDKIFPKFCQMDVSAATLCSVLIFSLVGVNPGQLDQQELPTILHGLAYTSFKNVVHYVQMSGARRFQLFDYEDKNIVIYGKVIPPNYPLDKITAPAAIMWSSNDLFSSPLDVTRLANLLPNLVDNYRIQLDDFNHLDYLYGLDAYSLVYEHLLSVLRKYDVDNLDESNNI